MKIKILGLTVFEMERALPATLSGPPPAPPGAPPKPRRPKVVPCELRPLADLHKAADLLPRTARGTLDLDEALRMFGLTDTTVLWQQKYPSESAGTALKRAAGAAGRKPLQPANRLSPRTAAQAPGTPAADARPPAPSGLPKLETGQKQPAREISATPEASASSLPRDAGGRIDIAASLHVLELTDPKALWHGKVQPGIAAHELKKEIARALARGEAVAGITRRDMGLPD